MDNWLGKDNRRTDVQPIRGQATERISTDLNDVTKDAAFYTTTSRFVAWLGVFPQERQKLWLPKDDLRDSSSWVSPPLVLLRDIHSKR